MGPAGPALQGPGLGWPGKPWGTRLAPSGSGCSAFSFLTVPGFTPVPLYLHLLIGSPDLLGSLLEKGTWWC